MSSTMERLAAALADRYRVERELGQGGMATVYLAHDLRHERDVAIKVLHPDLGAALGGERFLSEIRTTARLQHPHILPLLDSGEADGLLYYVMPVVTGETLRSRLNRERQLPVPDAVRIAREVASALDYAHRQGVIHRDVKPENILLHDGQALVADFGIALAVQTAGGQRMTQTGLSLGTPQYMSPEQAMGDRTIDARSDIYALGAVTYEMLTGEPPFTGATVQAIVARVLTEKPAPITITRETVLPAVENAVLTALAKLPADRFRTPAEFAAGLAGDAPRSSDGRSGASPRATAYAWRRWLADPRSLATLALLGLASVSLAFLAMRASSAPTDSLYGPTTLRFVVGGVSDTGMVEDLASELGDLPVVSPDGRTVAIPLVGEVGGTLYLRSLDSFELQRVEGGGRGPFFSPDGSSLAFFRESVLWTMRLADRTASLIARIDENFWDIGSSAWHPDGRLLIPGARGLWSVPASGGAATLLIPAPTAIEKINRVTVLPDGRLVLGIQMGDSIRLDVTSSDGAARRIVALGLEAGAIVEDVLVTKSSGQWRATRLDPAALTPVGASVTAPDIPAGDVLIGRSLAVITGNNIQRELVWVTRAGVVTPFGLEPGLHRWPRLAPDGSRLALGGPVQGSGRQTGGEQRIWVVDLRTRGRRPLDMFTEPVWTSDGQRIVASIGGQPFAGLGEQIADGSRGVDTLLRALPVEDTWPTDLSRDGAWIVYYGAGHDTVSGRFSRDLGDIMFLDRKSGERRRLRLAGYQRGGRLSPDGRWLAYQSFENGRSSVHVRPFPALDADYLVSAGEGEQPAWSPDGRELYYRRGHDMMVVPVRPGGTAFGTPAPTVLFTGTFFRDASGDQDYDVARDGRFLMMRPVALAESNVRIHVVLDWLADVRARLDRAR
jgi:eukaryotic-like serine/threonine-protein kinase